MHHVRNSEQLVSVFAIPPAGRSPADGCCSFFHVDTRCSGPTPIVPVFRRVLRDKIHEIAERKLLILLATDGVPTDSQGHRDIRSFEYVLKHERKPADRIPVTVIACTGESIADATHGTLSRRCLDDHDCIGYLNDWDKKIPNLDVVDDYRHEKREIQARQGKNFPFSFGDVSAARVHRAPSISFVRPVRGEDSHGRRRQLVRRSRREEGDHGRLRPAQAQETTMPDPMRCTARHGSSLCSIVSSAATVVFMDGHTHELLT